MSIILVLFLVLFVVFGLAALLVLRKLSAAANRTQQLKAEERIIRERLNAYRARCTDYQRRFTIVNRHATDYVNSLRGDTSKNMLQFSELMDKQLRTINQIEKVLLNITEAELIRANDLLTKCLRQRNEDNSNEVPVWEFENHAEEILQAVGMAVYQAAENMRKLGLHGRRDGKSAAEDLASEAGIRGIVLE